MPLNTGIAAPSIVGIDWRLDYSIRSKNAGRENTTMFYVALRVKDRGVIRDINMMATMEELQDLLSKVRRLVLVVPHQRLCVQVDPTVSVVFATKTGARRGEADGEGSQQLRGRLRIPMDTIVWVFTLMQQNSDCGLNISFMLVALMLKLNLPPTIVIKTRKKPRRKDIIPPSVRRDRSCSPRWTQWVVTPSQRESAPKAAAVAGRAPLAGLSQPWGGRRCCPLPPGAVACAPWRVPVGAATASASSRG